MHTIDRTTIATADLDQVADALDQLPENTATSEVRSLVEQLRNANVTILTDDEDVTPNQAAELLRMSRPMVVRLVDKGELRANIVGKRDRRIPTSEIRNFLERRDRASKQFAEALATGTETVRRAEILRRAGVSSEDAAQLGF